MSTCQRQAYPFLVNVNMNCITAGCRDLKHLDLSFSGPILSLSPLQSCTGLQTLTVHRAADSLHLGPLSEACGLRRLDIILCQGVCDLLALGSCGAELRDSVHQRLRVTRLPGGPGRLQVVDATAGAFSRPGFQQGCLAHGSLEKIFHEVLDCDHNCNRDRWLLCGSVEGLMSRINPPPPQVITCSTLVDIRTLASSQLPVVVLDLSSCTLLADVSPIASLAQTLQTLKLSGCHGLPTASPVSWGPSEAAATLAGVLLQLSRLENLSLDTCKMTSSSWILGPPGRAPPLQLPPLRSLSLCNCPLLDNLGALSELQLLTRLDLSSCAGIVNVSPLTLLPSLNSLTLKNCTGLTDLAKLLVEGGGGYLTRLEMLDLRGCPSARKDLQPLALCKSLTHLTLSHGMDCDFLKRTGLTVVRKKY